MLYKIDILRSTNKVYHISEVNTILKGKVVLFFVRKI